MSVAEVELDALPEPGFLINGEHVTASSQEPYPHRYAATGRLTYEVPLGGAPEMDAAVRAARAAFPAWKRVAPNERRRLMLAFATAVREQSDELSRLITAENGSPFMAVQGAPKWVAEL